MPVPTYGGLSYAFYNGDGATTTFPLGFEYLAPEHVVVQVDGAVISSTSGSYTVTNSTVVFTEAPAVSQDIRLIRVTPRDYDARLVDFRSFGNITEKEMDLNQKQVWFLIQEAIETDDTGAVNPTAGYITWDLVKSRWSALRGGQPQTIGDLTDPTLEDEAATKRYVDGIAEFGISGIPQGWTVTTTSNTTAYVLHGGYRLEALYLIVSIAGVLQVPGVDFVVQPGDPDSTLVFVNLPPPGLVVNIQNFGKARFLNQFLLGDNNVTTNTIADGAVTNPKIADGAITQAKMAADSVGGPQILDGAIGTVKVFDGTVTYAKMAKAGFSPAPGGAFDKVLKVDNNTGTLSQGNILTVDIQDWPAALGSVPLNVLGAANNNINLGNNRITNLSLPVGANDAASKTYVDNAIGTGVGAKVDQLGDYILGLASTTWTFLPAPAPAWFHDPTYLYYEVIVSSWAWTGPGKCFLRFYQAGAYNEDLYFLGLTVPTQDFRSVWSFRVQNPRDGASKPHGMPHSGTYGMGGSPIISFGPADGMALRVESSAIPVGARIQVYGHRALT